MQNEMSAVCEVCWGRGEDVEGRETLVPNCLLYLVARTFSEGATVSKTCQFLICVSCVHVQIFTSSPPEKGRRSSVGHAGGPLAARFRGPQCRFDQGAPLVHPD